MGYTDLQRKMPPGSFRVRLALFDGSGPFTATARVESGKKTKCQLASGKLTCAAPH
jgi:hypothetical protein